MDSTIDQEGMTQQNDMNGLWSGEYAYDMEEAPAVFSVWIDDQAGILRGTITEPNTFVHNALEELDANLNGVRDGQIVDFVKIYSPRCGAHQTPIHYEGTANTDFTIVRGIWHFNDPNILAGKFTLSRVSKSLEKEVMRRRIASPANDVS